jgi:hypothetical protein
MLFHPTFYIATKLMDIIKIRTLGIFFLSGVRVDRSFVLCMFCSSLFVPLYFFLLAIVMSVLLRFTDSDYPFGIFKLFFSFVVCHVHVTYTINYKIIFKLKSYKICYSIFKNNGYIEYWPTKQNILNILSYI